jgi:hypothetical protein
VPKPFSIKPAIICTSASAHAGLRHAQQHATAESRPADGIDPEFSVGDTTYYKLEAKTAWYFPGLFKGHVLEAVGRAGIADSLSSGDVPFYDRYYLGGLTRCAVSNTATSPRVIPIIWAFQSRTYRMSRSAATATGLARWNTACPFLKRTTAPACASPCSTMSAPSAGPYSFSGNFDDNWGLGLHINIPKLGPLRLEYGIPIHHDQYNGASGRFQFGVGWQRPF